ncbi:14922_t:CDS:2, partial [Cetraspora pellucida]
VDYGSDAKFTRNKEKEVIKYDGYNEYKGRHHPIENVGSGYLRHKKLKSLAKILSLNEKKPVERLALIDEPELFLHPSLIGDIANSIKELEKKGVTLIMTTHSPFFLSQFIHEKGVNLAIAKGEGGSLSKLLYFSEIIENAKRIIVETKKILFVEGITEYIFFNSTSLRSKIPEFDGIEVIPIFNEDENLVKRAGPILTLSRLLSQREKEEKKDKERNLKKEKPFQNCRHVTKTGLRGVNIIHDEESDISWFPHNLEVFLNIDEKDPHIVSKELNIISNLEFAIDNLDEEKNARLHGNLAKNKIIELALKFDKELLKLLLSSPEIKKIFFQEVEGILVFDKIKFQSFVSNKQFLPDSFTKYKNKIGLTANGQYLADSKE